MIPIYENGGGRGIGHNLRSFIDRFADICERHAHDGDSRFALLFYDFRDHALREILEDPGVFATLDRLAGTQLGLFFLHKADSPGLVDAFNAYFLTLLGVREKARPPCLVFFRVRQERVEDVEVAQLEQATLIHGLHELYRTIEWYLARDRAKAARPAAVAWPAVAPNVVPLAEFRRSLRRVL